MAKETTAHRAIAWSAGIALGAAVAGWLGGDAKTALGICVGAGVALFSLWTLVVIAERIRPGARPVWSALLGPLYFAKLAIIAAILWSAVTLDVARPLAIFAGALIVPVVIVGLKLKSALSMAFEPLRQRFR